MSTEVGFKGKLVQESYYAWPFSNKMNKANKKNEKIRQNKAKKTKLTKFSQARTNYTMLH